MMAGVRNNNIEQGLAMNRRNFLRSSIAAGVSAVLPASQVYAAMQALTTPYSDVAGVSGSGDEVIMSQAAVQELSDRLRGGLLLPGNAGYDIARRVLNSGIDRHPALVVQPVGVTDIRNAVDFARDNNLLLAVKCGGHSYSGKSTCEGGMQIDLSTFRHVRIDRSARTAYVAGGSLLGEIDRESMPAGLVTTAGTVSHTGVGGLTTGGGFGRVARRFGLALDNVKAVDVVTADGKLVHASAEENEDLYWGVRGGGGNFGIVTSFEFALHPMQREVVAGEIMFPMSRAKDVLSFYSEFMHTAPDDLYCDCMIAAPTDASKAGAGLSICYSGPEGGADKALAPIKKLGEPMFTNVAAKDYVAVQKSWDNTDPRNEGQYLKGGFVNEIPGELVDGLVEGFESDPGRSTTLYFQHSGGAIGRVAADATAFAHRKSMANMIFFIAWDLDSDGDPHVAWLRDYWQSVEKFTDGFYTNEVSTELQRVVNGNYQGNYERLLRVKNQYDPTNLFRLNANITPTV